MTLSEWLQARKGELTRQAFAQRVGCSPANITHICAGARPKPDLAHRIVEATDGDVTLADLYPPSNENPEFSKDRSGAGAEVSNTDAP